MRTKRKAAERPLKDQVADLSAAVAKVEESHPLPRCRHGNAVRDHAGDQLAPSCGCTKCAHAVTERRRATGGPSIVVCKACGDWGPA